MKLYYCFLFGSAYFNASMHQAMVDALQWAKVFIFDKTLFYLFSILYIRFMRCFFLVLATQTQYETFRYVVNAKRMPENSRKTGESKQKKYKLNYYDGGIYICGALF